MFSCGLSLSKRKIQLKSHPSLVPSNNAENVCFGSPPINSITVVLNVLIHSSKHSRALPSLLFWLFLRWSMEASYTYRVTSFLWSTNIPSGNIVIAFFDNNLRKCKVGKKKVAKLAGSLYLDRQPIAFERRSTVNFGI